MIVGLGTDLVHIPRLERWLLQPGLLAKYFSETELADVQTSQNPAASLAVRFAAKEAFGKALGSGMAGLRLRDIEIQRDPQGRPHLVLYAQARQRLQTQALKTHLSLSHEKDYALAFVVLED